MKLNLLAILFVVPLLAFAVEPKSLDWIEMTCAAENTPGNETQAFFVRLRYDAQEKKCLSTISHISATIGTEQVPSKCQPPTVLSEKPKTVESFFIKGQRKEDRLVDAMALLVDRDYAVIPGMVYIDDQPYPLRCETKNVFWGEEEEPKE